mmetsp:Transcript_20554/g.53955  ORF Transcript_20554/g.53955 Transcript_20554/m.53955 type:complete len:335 (-) Transcript_20554:299-1303(-)
MARCAVSFVGEQGKCLRDLGVKKPPCCGVSSASPCFSAALLRGRRDIVSVTSSDRVDSLQLALVRAGLPGRAGVAETLSSTRARVTDLGVTSPVEAFGERGCCASWLGGLASGESKRRRRIGNCGLAATGTAPHPARLGRGWSGPRHDGRGGAGVMAPTVGGAAVRPAACIPALATSCSRSCRYRRKLACADIEKTTHRPESHWMAALLSCPMAVPTELTVLLSKRRARFTKSCCSSSGESRTVLSTHHGPPLRTAALPADCGLPTQAPVIGASTREADREPNRILAAGSSAGELPARSSQVLAILHSTLAFPLPSAAELAGPRSAPLGEVAQL